MSNVLVTGAAGFVGSHLVDSLLADGHDVTGIDNLSTGNKSNVEHLADNKNFTFVERDIVTGLGDLESAKFDQIFHLASPASPPHYMRLALETMHVNTVATELLLKYAAKNDSRLLFASTSEIYGDPHEHPQKESYWGNVNPIGPRSIYDEAKRFGETLLSHFHRSEGTDTVIVRIFNTYGPRMDPNDGRVVSSFIRDGIKGKSFQVFGDGKQTRDFLYVDDAVDAASRACTKGDGLLLHVGSGQQTSIKDLWALIGENSPATMDAKGNRGVQRMSLSGSRARLHLGWTPWTSLGDGLSATTQAATRP